MRTFLLILSLLFVHNSAYSIYPIVRNFSKTHYKSGTQNWDIVQNPGGCIYFANNNGVLEFDGKDWATYPIANYTNVRSVFYDAESRRLYAGAFNEFGYYQLDNAGGVVYQSLMQAFDSIKDISEIWKIYKIEHSFYLQSNRDVYKYNADTIQTYHFNHKIDCSAVVHNSLLVSNREEGPMILTGNSFMSLPYTDELIGKKVCAILPYEKNKMLFVTDFHGVYLYDGKHLEPWSLDIDPFIKQNQVFCAATDGKSIAFGTVANGLFVKNLSDNSTLHVNTFSGMQNNTVLSVGFDRSGNLWLGLDKGIDYVVINTPEFSLFGSENLYGSGYASLVYKEKLYLGTNQGLYYMDYPLTNQQQTVKSVQDMKGQVWYLTEIDNTLFCGHDRGVFIITGDRAERIPHVNGTWKLERMKNRPDYILGCSYDGLFFLHKRNGHWTFSHYLKGFKESSGMFAEDNDGTIWMTHWMKGLFRLTLDAQADSVLNVEYFAENRGFPTSRNNLVNEFRNRIIFSSDAGFYKFDLTRNKAVLFDELNKYFATLPAAAHLYESPYGDLFFMSGTMQAVAFRNPDQTYTLDSISLNFLQDKRIFGFENVNCIDRNHVLCSTENGFSWINLAKVRANEKKLGNDVFIKSVYLTNNNKDSLIYASRGTIEQQSVRKLPFKYNSLRFEFVVPEFEKEDAVEYSYFLENYDKEWSSYSMINMKEYTKLPQGDYTFHVRAKNRFRPGVSETAYHIEILPPWYLSSTAYYVYFILFVILIWLLIRFDRMRSRLKEAEVEFRKEEEMREQQLRFEEDARKRELEIVMLKNQTLEYNLRHKSQDLATSTMNLIRKNEILLKIKEDLDKLYTYVSGREDEAKMVKLLGKVQKDIRENIEHDDDWQKFEHNFDMVYEDYLKRLGERFPQLTVGDKRLCAYLKMDLCSKDIAPLLNMSVRSVEMARYRLRKKMELSRDVNLTDFLQHF